MRFYRSRSILQFILTGFFLIALLLIIGQLAAIVAVDRLARESRQAVYDAADILHASQVLSTDIMLMERGARQFHVIDDPALYEVYVDRRARFLQNAQRLAAMPLSDLQRGRVELLMSQEAEIFQMLSDAADRRSGVRPAIEQFWGLSALGRAILTESGQSVGEEVERIQDIAGKTQRRLIWHAVALIPAALILAAVYSALINRPIRQIAGAIRGLGEGQVTMPIEVTGPRDLEDLGKQLDWLRMRLRALEQHKITILRNISHELKTPLAAIREGVELLSDEVPGTLNRQQTEIAQILRSNSQRLQKLIEDLINFSIAQAEDPFLNERPVQLHRLIDRLVDEQKLIVAAHGITVRRELTEATVIGDQEKIKSIFDNLLSNAIKYSPDGGEIQISLGRDTGRAVVDVRDQGPGIDPREREQVFEAFFQGHKSARGPVKGSGLGLSIAHAYVRLHKGSIQVMDSNRGAHVRVALPLAGA